MTPLSSAAFGLIAVTRAGVLNVANSGAVASIDNCGALQVTNVCPLLIVIVGMLSETPPGRMTCMFTAVIVGILDEALATAR